MLFEFSLQFIDSSGFRWEVFVDLSVECGGITEVLLDFLWFDQVSGRFVGFIGVSFELLQAILQLWSGITLEVKLVQ